MPEPCPPEDAFVQLLEGELDEEERAAITRHADTCADCAALLVDLALLLRPEEGADTPAALSAATSLGRYTILRQLGAGGMGVVYEAEDPTLKRRVALKVLRADVDGEERRRQLQSRLLREAQALAALEHPNVLAVYDAFTWQEQVVLAVQFVDGASAAQWLQAEPRTWRERLDLFLQAGKGLAAAHAAGIVHRDIKPDNILVSRTGGVFVADFGLARTVSDDLQEVEEGAAGEGLADTRNLHASLLTHTGTVLGTPAYMAPEQHLALPTDARTDQFSFAASLFRALYDLKPFEGDSLHALRDAVTHGRLRPSPLPSDVPRPLYDVLAVALAVKPDERFPHLSDLLNALEEAARPPAPTPQGRRGRTFAGVALGTLAAAALAGGVASSFREEPPAPAPPPAVALAPSTATPEPPPPPTLDQAALCGRGDLDACDRFSRAAMTRFFDAEPYFSLKDDIAAPFEQVMEPLLEPLEQACERGAPEPCLLCGVAASVRAQGNLSPRDAATLQTFTRFTLRACELGSGRGCELAFDLARAQANKALLPPTRDAIRQAAQRGCDAGRFDACLSLARDLPEFDLDTETLQRMAPLLERACDLGASEGCLFGAILLQPAARRCPKGLETLNQLIGTPDNAYLLFNLEPEASPELCEAKKGMAAPARALELARKGCDHTQEAPGSPFRAASCALALDLQPQLLKGCRSDEPEACQQAAHLLAATMQDPLHWNSKREPWFLKQLKGLEKPMRAACEAGSAEACLISAQRLSFLPKEGFLLATGATVPAYVDLLERSCDLGDLTACAAYLGAWLEGDYDDEGAWSIKPTNATGLQHLLPRCERDPRVCWLTGESLFDPVYRAIRAEPAKALALIDQACERADLPLACLFSALLRLDAPSEEAEAFLIATAALLPNNNILTGKADLDDARQLTRKTAPLQDAAAGLAMAQRGCAAETPRYLQAVQDASCALVAWGEVNAEAQEPR